MKKLFIQTFGCQMNQYDSERIAGVMSRADYALTDSVESADMILLNTCSVRDKAEQKVYSALGRFRELKQRRAQLLLRQVGDELEAAPAGVLEHGGDLRRAPPEAGGRQRWLRGAHGVYYAGRRCGFN